MTRQHGTAKERLRAVKVASSGTCHAPRFKEIIQRVLVSFRHCYFSERGRTSGCEDPVSHLGRMLVTQERAETRNLNRPVSHSVARPAITLSKWKRSSSAQ